jgi:hypothetical protein
MQKLTELPLVFVNYPSGAGGWFLASMLQQCVNPKLELVVDHLGSGHANTYIYHINMFYRDKLLSEIGKSIIDNANYHEFSKDQRILHLQDSVGINNFTDRYLMISLHCANLDIFQAAFPQAKFININIDDHNIETCRYNTLYKALKVRPELFEGMVDTYKKDYNECLARVQDLNRENLEWFNWIDHEIKKFNPNNRYENSEHVLNVSYDEYMSTIDELFLSKLLNFLNLDIDDELFDKTIGNLVLYRISQPKLPQ